jgi:hypothetical protein
MCVDCVLASPRIAQVDPGRRTPPRGGSITISLNDQGHSPRPRGEDLLQQLYAYDGLQYRIQFLET